MVQCAGQYSFYTVQSGTTMWKELGGFHNITKVWEILWTPSYYLAAVQGCGATILRDIPFGMVYFPTYNSLKVSTGCPKKKSTINDNDNNDYNDGNDNDNNYYIN